MFVFLSYLLTVMVCFLYHGTHPFLLVLCYIMKIIINYQAIHVSTT